MEGVDRRGRPKTSCASLGLDFAEQCEACKNPQRKKRCWAAAGAWPTAAPVVAPPPPAAPSLDSTLLDAPMPTCLMEYMPEDWHRRPLPAEAKRKAVQDVRTEELRSRRESLRQEEIAAVSNERMQRFMELVEATEQKLAKAEAELLATRCECNKLMSARRQGTLANWLRRPEEDRPSMQLPTRASHFDVDAALANGYSQSELSRTFRSHVEKVEHFIEQMVSDPLKQLQLADAVNRRFAGVRSSLPRDDEAAQYILESLRNFEATLRERYEGRYPNEIRAVHQAVSAAIVSKVPWRKLSVVAEATGFSKEALADGRKRWMEWFDGSDEHLIEFRGRIRSDKMEEEWIDFAALVWKEETRPDPSTKNSIRNPHKRSDKKLYRIHYLDMRIGDMLEIILRRGREKFADADPPFHFSWWYCIKVRPFFVKPAGRETSVCIYHLRFDLIVEALYVFYKRLRDAKVCSCVFPNIKYPADYRRTLVCSRPEGSRYDCNECVTTECVLCGELQQLNICGCIEVDSNAWLIRWEEYQKIEYKRKDGSVAEKWDFVVVNTTFQKFLEHFSNFWRTFAIHHQTAKLQDDDIRYIKLNPERGVVSDVEDFSENDHIKPMREHASRYFSEVGYTLYGMVLTGHLDDFKNLEEDKREELRAHFQKKKLPLAITETHIVISGDLNHDPAAVMHYNDKLLTPYIKANMMNITKRIRITDGAPQHFKLADTALWTSKQQVETGILSENLFGATAHRKDLSDSECGGAKHVVHRVQITSGAGETSKVKGPYDAFEVIRDEYGQLTHERFMKQGGVGIYRRFIYWVPACGEGSIDRHIQKCKTLKTKELGGIKSLHQLCDIGIPGSLRVRQCSCHQCPACQAGQYGRCENLSLLGPTETVTLEPDGGRSVRLTRNALSDAGVLLSREVCSGEIIGVELTGMNESFMLAEVLSPSGPYAITTASESVMGLLQPGDLVLDIRKLEPTSLGSSMYEVTEKQFPIFIEDIRKRNMQNELSETDTSRRSERVADGAAADAPSQRKLYKLSPQGKADLLKLTAGMSEIGDRREIRQLAQ